MLQELGMEGLEERLSSATQHPASPAYRLSRMVTEVTQMQVCQASAVALNSGTTSAGRCSCSCTIVLASLQRATNIASHVFRWSQRSVVVVYCLGAGAVGPVTPDLSACRAVR